MTMVWCAWLSSKLTRPEHRESVEYCQEEDVKQETKMQMSWRPLSRNLGFTPPQQCHKLITSMPRRIEAVIKEKEPLPSIEYILYTVNEHTFQKDNDSLKMCFIGLMKYYNLLRVNWWVFVKCEPKSSQLKNQRLKLLQSVCIEFI